MNRFRLTSIALISVSLLGLELIWTRIFSAEYFYTFAFLTLSLAILGLGLGALSLRLFGSFARERNLGLFMTLTGVAALFGPPLVVGLGLDFSILFTTWSMIGRFVVALALLSSAFFFGGAALALYFRTHHQDMPRMYMADLLGAGAGVILAILLMNGLSTPTATFLFAIPVLLAALLTANRWWKVAPAVFIVVAGVMSPQAENWLEAERVEHGRVIYKHWDAMAKIKIWDFDGHYRGMNIDNVANTPVLPFDGDIAALDTTDLGWDLPVRDLIERFDSCTFLSLGAGGGGDVLQALDHGAAEIHAVEVLPHINRMMTTGDTCGYLDYEAVWADSARVRDSVAAIAASEAIDSTTTDSITEIAEEEQDADSSAPAQPAAPPAPPLPVFRDSTGRIITCAAYSGYIYDDPRVKVISEDARTYVRRHRNEFDLIYSFSSNSWAALGSGSFALAENYIFTTEAFIDYWHALSDSGFLSMEHQVYMPRLLTEALDALEQVGVQNPSDHIAVYNLPAMRRKMMLLSKQPLTDTIIQNAYGPLTPERQNLIHLLYPLPDSAQPNLYSQIVEDGWESMADTIKVDISPCTDNRPFVAQLGLWRNLNQENLSKVNIYADFMGFPLSKLVIVIIIGVVLVILIPLNLVPYLKKGPKLRLVPWLYFFAIGVAFMMVEVVLIQKYALVIGASVYSISTVLLTLLIASGIGSRFARSFPPAVVFGAILVWLALDITVFGPLTSTLVGLPTLGRVLGVAVLILPLGFFMGMPFPKATLRVGELVDWGFAVNGVASVLGATLVVLIAINFGFVAALVLGGLTYLAAWSLLTARTAWR